MIFLSVVLGFLAVAIYVVAVFHLALWADDKLCELGYCYLAPIVFWAITITLLIGVPAGIGAEISH